MTRGAALVEALLVTLATPATWPLALSAFLVRGGILAVTIPVLVLPTPVGLGNLLAPSLTSLALGTVPLTALVAGVLGGLALAAWIGLGGWLAAALEAEGARIVAADADLPRPVARAAAPEGGGPDRLLPHRHVAARILAARLVAALPLAVVLAWGAARIVSVTYRELVLPSDSTTAIAVRVVRGIPEVILAVVLAWMVAEILGALAGRRIAVAGDGVRAALRAAVLRSARQPVQALVRFWVPTVILIGVLAASAIATSSAWGAVGAMLGGRSEPIGLLASMALFVGLWLASLFLLAVTCAWRAAVWTVAEVTAPGTFGGSTDRRPGDWRTDRSSARL